MLSPKRIRCCVVDRPLWDLAIIQMSVHDEIVEVIPDTLLSMPIFFMRTSFHSVCIAIKSSIDIGSIWLAAAIIFEGSIFPMVFISSSFFAVSLVIHYCIYRMDDVLVFVFVSHRLASFTMCTIQHHDIVE